VRLWTIEIDRVEVGAVEVADALVPLPALGDDLPATVLGCVQAGLDTDLRTRIDARASASHERVAIAEARPRPLYRNPRKLWGIGLNYRAHADDLGAPHPDEPASFMKGDHTIIGPDDTILLPAESHRVTAEAELGLVIGQECRDVADTDALSVLAGVCPVLDQTAEDILQRNPRFLTVAKNFPTFFSFGPALVTIDEVLERFGTLGAIRVETVRNGRVHRGNVVEDMLFSPERLIGYHSHVMPLFPGDVISSGTPGAVVIEDGDLAECRIDGIGTLRNPVRAGPPPGSGR
jgi:2-keto-4-pentenoate hydratase/2-oxohepta-3-ene-1,7-dioic acid hydratase in catechol pathway